MVDTKYVLWLNDNLHEYKARLVAKQDSSLMKIIGVLLAVTGNKTFMTRYFTTIGRTIYYPTSMTDPYDASYKVVMEHEITHLKQMATFFLPSWVWGIFYLMIPLPVLFAYYRWKFEREAYSINLEHAKGIIFSTPQKTSSQRILMLTQIEATVMTLWNDYGWCWPKPLMRKWFSKRLQLTE